MKIKIIIISFFTILFFGSCNVLDYNESTIYEKDDVFSLYQRSRQFLTSIYSYVPEYNGRIGNALRSAACDEAIFIDRLSAVHGFNNGTWSAINTLDSRWNYFEPIRSVNLFLEEIKGQTFDDLKNNTDYKDIMDQFHYFPYEARFLRAYFYFELAKRYGDIPLITTVLTENEANSLERTPFDEVIKFIADECDAIDDELLVDYTIDFISRERGRITKSAAMALKSRALLYAASPLFNPANDKAKWEKAAKAAADMIKIAELPKADKTADRNNPGYGLGLSFPALADLWNRNYAQNTELIFGVLRGTSNSFESQNYPIGIFGGGTTGHCPTQNLVESYEMQATGLPVSSSAGYESADPAYNPQNPYAGRDPRLNASIVVNNSIWPTRYAEPVEIWRGGRSGKPVNYATSTGYYLKKYVDGNIELRPDRTATTSNHVWNVIRYSEVLLNYAEAMIEAYGDYNKTSDGSYVFPMSARDAVNKVRARSNVNMPPFPATLSVAEFKLKLRNERRVELAFEDHRFWDIRRWKIADQVKNIYGVDIEKTGDNTFSYTKVLVEERVFSEKMYLFPIPQAELFINTNLRQNQGW